MTKRNTNLALTCPSIARSFALGFARGSYQEAIINGSQRLSGADLKGKARRYAGHYARSRANLMARLNDAVRDGQLAVTEVRGRNGRRELVWGKAAIAALLGRTLQELARASCDPSGS